MDIDPRFEVNPFAETNFRNQSRKFGIKLDDRRRHVYIVGKTGMGKTVVEENMIYNDIRAGYGVAVVDPHGELIEHILELIPAKRVNDVVYFNPSDVDYPIAFNPLESVDPKYRHLVASGLVTVFKKIWADSWGPRLEYILRNAILSLLEYPGSTLLGITRILVDKYYRKKVLEKVSDPVVRSFWVDEYDNYNEKFRTEAISPIQNKIGQFLSSAVIRNIVGQPKSSIDLRDIMDNKKILLMDLSKGRVGEDNSALLGAMMITKIQLAAMSRIDTPEEERQDFFLYVDEFQNFATESFATILSEARKYRLDLIIAHQYIEQLGDVVKAAVFGNVGTMICFRVGAEDAEFLEKEFGPTFTQTDLVALPKFHIYLKLMIDGVTSDAFSATTLPPVGTKTGSRDKVVKVSRERYAKNRAVVEERILRWAGVEETFKESAQQDSKSLSPEDQTYRVVPNHLRQRGSEAEDLPRLNVTQLKTQLFEADCWVCGRKVQLPFKPDGIRPVYCKDDMRKIRQGLIPKPKPRLIITEQTPPQAPAGLPTVESGALKPEPDTTLAISSTPPAPPVKKVEPLVSPLPAAISLSQAMKQEPVKFNRQVRQTRPAKQVERPAPTGPQAVKPGQVIRFD
ncbi:MAG: type IV secretion system DNA-binding domain-containing protein [Candidatus Kerfeldbacteria bacterium]|nr:type IV secretion system DNA-binding domain-containing protein [Candidatus Kerfeldbacteria bacterium]